MDLLKKRILQDGKCFEGGILKVDSFINHQMDPILMKSIGVEFVRRFANKDFNKVMTIEASGIAPAIMVGYLLELPVVFAKKKQPKTMENMISTTVRSFTKDREYNVCISKDFLSKEDRVLFIDDFLANGNAANGIIDLIDQAGAQLAKRRGSPRSLTRTRLPSSWTTTPPARTSSRPSCASRPENLRISTRSQTFSMWARWAWSMLCSQKKACVPPVRSS